MKNSTYNTLMICSFAIITTLITLLSTAIFSEYGYTIFVILPLLTGLGVSILYRSDQSFSVKKALILSLGCFLLSCIIMLLSGIEGVICLIMATPIAIPFILIGTWIGITIKKKRRAKLLLFLFYSIVTPSLMSFESAFLTAHKTFNVSSYIEINAPIEKVWNTVIEFPIMSDPNELLFKVGISYPIDATIDGKGPGAIRYCNFNTGSFVEPITTWKAPYLLQFTVEEQPIPMKELSPYNIHPKHLHGYFVSKKGEFRLEKISENKTLITGTTWYHNNIKPQVYWSFWSDHIIHKIHHRVLNHIKNTCETNNNF